MTRHLTLQRFILGEYELVFDRSRSILTCRSVAAPNKKLWGKKLHEVNYIATVLEDEEKYYVACEIEEHTGLFLALRRESGITAWFIPGKSYLQLIYEGYLFLIFVDDSMEYFLLKVDREDGKTVWFHGVDEDLYEYRFNKNGITLTFGTGMVKHLDLLTGKVKRGEKTLS